MSFFEFPHTRTYDSDLGFIIKTIKKLTDEYGTIDAWKTTHEREYQELYDQVQGIIDNLVNIIIPWDSSIAYSIYSIVEYQGTNYIAIQDVPIGTMITNTDYWIPANTVVEQINAISVTTSEIKKDALHYYLRPQDFGAVGDGVTDDTVAFTDMISKVNDMIVQKTFTDVNPSEMIGGIEIYIPAGNYIINDSLKIPSGIVTRGAGINASILQFSGSYGISLDGKSYNGLKYWTGKISDIRINMNGGGTGLSNAELCGINNVDQNAVHHSTFERIMISNADTGFAIIGGWINRFEECQATACDYGFILTRLTGINGNNANALHNCVALSMKACGFWLDASGILMDSCNAESIGNTWQGTYNGETVTLAGESISVPSPAGIYCSNLTRGTFKRCWFERITNVDNTVTYGILINTAVSGGAPVNGGILIESPLFNSDVWHPVRSIVPSIIKLVNPHWTVVSSSGLLLSVSECTFGSYFVDTIDGTLANYIGSDITSQYNRIYITNVALFGSNGIADRFSNANIGTQNAFFGRERFLDSAGIQYDKVRRIQSNIGDAADYYNNVAMEVFHYTMDEQCVKFPTNSKVITVPANTHTVTVSFGQPDHSNSNAAGVLLTARNAEGASLIAGGYYWYSQNASDHTITIYFINTSSSAVTLDAFIFKQA